MHPGRRRRAQPHRPVELFAVADQITLGAPPEFETRTPFGLKGFADIYDANFKEFVLLASADIKDALSGGQIDCGNIFSTDPAITTDGSSPSTTIRTSAPARRSCR